MNCPEGFFCFQKSMFILFLCTIIIALYMIIKHLDKSNNYISNPNKNSNNYNQNSNNYNQNSNKDNLRYKRINDPLYPPRKSYQPINIHTRGESNTYQQVGFLHNNSNKLPVYGKQTYPGSNKYNYYTNSDDYHSIKLPILKNNKDCTDDMGCDELQNNDNITVTSYNDSFEFTSYNFDKPRYIPYVY